MRRALILAVLVIIFALTACASSPSPTPVDPWVKAVSEAQALITTANLEEHIQFYETQSAEVDRYLRILEKLQPALDTLERLKGIDIPFVGNAWDILVKALDASAPGAGQALTTLDRELRHLLTYREHLQSLQEQDTLLGALEQFAQNPTPQTLRTLDKEAQTALPRLRQTKEDITEVRKALINFLDGFSLLQQGIQGVGGLVNQVWEVQGALEQLNNALGDAQQPLQEFDATLGTWESYLNEDITYLDRLHEIVHTAENPRPSTKPSSQVPEWVPILLIVSVMLLLGAVILFFAWPRKRAPVPEPAHAGEWGKSSTRDAGPPEIQLQPPSPLPAPQPVSVGVGIRPARLRIIRGPMSGHAFIVDEDDVVIGRSQTATFRISDPYVSRRHCRLRYAQNTWFIQDLDSTSGTFVNGRRVSATALQSGDRIQVGQTQMVFEL